MSDAGDLFTLLRQTADGRVVDAIEAMVAGAPDHALCRINALAVAARHGLDEEQTISAFLNASKMGMFDISWNVLCPGCGGVLETNASLRTVQREEYACALCADSYSATLDEMVDVTFTANPKLRRIEAHSPADLPPEEYYRQLYWGSGIDVPVEDYARIFAEFVLDHVELAPGERGVLSTQLPAEFVIVFEPVTHSAQFIDVKGEPTRERRSLSLLYDREHRHHQTLTMRPGPLRLTLDNRSDSRTLPTVFIAGHALHNFLHRRRPFLTAKRLLSNQTFRDLFRTNTLDVDQRLKITSLTFLFTDLRGSTELYERVGDLVAFDLVRSHFQVLQDIVAAGGGAVVKTIGDAVMATFPTPDRAVAAALRMREAMMELNRRNGGEDLLLKIGVHEGPCIAVTMNERQDYFGQTVNIASRVQGLATAQAIFATGAVIADGKAGELLEKAALVPEAQSVSLRGITREVAVFAIP